MHAFMRRMKTIEQTLVYVGGIVVAARRLAELFKPFIDFVRQRLRRIILPDRHRLIGWRPAPRRGPEARWQPLLAVERHRTTAVAVEVGEPIATKLQLNIDAIIAGCASSHLGTNVLQVFADLQLLDAPLGPVGMSLLYRAAAEES